jgi:hypothetical protein
MTCVVTLSRSEFFEGRIEMSKGLKRGLLCGAVLVAGTVCSMMLSAHESAKQSADNTSAVRASEVRSLNQAPSVDDTAMRYRRWRRRAA